MYVVDTYNLEVISFVLFPTVKVPKSTCFFGVLDFVVEFVGGGVMQLINVGNCSKVKILGSLPTANPKFSHYHHMLQLDLNRQLLVYSTGTWL